jgi:carboxylesterase type B
MRLVTGAPLICDVCFLQCAEVMFSPICPQPDQKCLEEELIGLAESDTPRQVFKQDEFECLNLNITCPAGHHSESRLPVMVWIHG